MNTDQMMDALFAAPVPANEVVSLDRATADAILTELEASDPNRGIVVGLRLKLSAPKVELWAMHSPGPGLLHPMLSREEAEAQAKATADRCAEISQEKGWNLDPVTINVVPSPWEPTEHFQIAATERQEKTDRLRELAIGRGEELATTKVALEAAEQRNAAIVGGVTACRACGSKSLSWFTSYKNTSAAPEGRLRTNEVSCEFVLGCDDCSETLKVVSADRIAARMTATLKPAESVSEKAGELSS